jgi:hypothetical protein
VAKRSAWEVKILCRPKSKRRLLASKGVGIRQAFKLPIGVLTDISEFYFEYISTWEQCRCGEFESVW